MSVSIFNRQSDLVIDSSKIQYIVNLALKYKDIDFDEISIHFVGMNEITSLHKKHFNKNSPTDCITFPIDNPFIECFGPISLGEVFVCPKVAIQQSKDHSTSPLYELILYVIHGLLHLLGFEDTEEKSIEIMRYEEKTMMNYLQKKGVLDEN